MCPAAGAGARRVRELGACRAGPAAAAPQSAAGARQLLGLRGHLQLGGEGGGGAAVRAGGAGLGRGAGSEENLPPAGGLRAPGREAEDDEALLPSPSQHGGRHLKVSTKILGIFTIFETLFGLA